MDRLNTELKNRAVSLGLCAMWTKEWTEKDKDELCEMYKRGIDFCIEHDYPKNEYMKFHFNGVMQKHGIYVDDEIHTRSEKTCIFNGNCKGEVSYDKFDVGTIYVRHNSSITIIAEGNSKIFVEVYDKAKVVIIQKDEAKVFVYKKGGEITSVGRVVVRDRTK